MSLTVDELAKEIGRIYEGDGAWCRMVATGLLPFIQRHIAAGQQGAELTDDDLRSEWRAAGGEMHGPRVETVTMPEAAYLKFRRSLATPKPAGAVPDDIAELASDEGPLACAELHLRMTTLGCPDVDDGSLADGLRDARRDLKAYGDAREAAGRAGALPDGWSGWATQYPGKLPKLFGAREIAELNHYPEEGARLIYLIEAAPIPQQPAADDDHVLVERGLLGAACSAIEKKRDAPKVVEALRKITMTPAAEGDDIAVDRFADAMKAKMAVARAKGRGGWEGPTCNAEILSRMLRGHVEKGDPRDVANFCMMLWNRGESIQAAEGETRDEKIARVQTGLREQAKRFRDPIELAQEIHGATDQGETVSDVLAEYEMISKLHGNPGLQWFVWAMKRIKAAVARETAAYTVECVHTTTQEGTCFFEVKTDDPPESGAKLYTRPTPAADAGGVTVTEEMVERVARQMMRERYPNDSAVSLDHSFQGNSIYRETWIARARRVLTAALTPEVHHGE